jgi:hypothetical protein
VHAARRHGVLTATLVHGTPNASNYLPVLADEVLAWGRVQEAWFRAHGVGAGIHLVGRPDVTTRALHSSETPRVVIANSAEHLSETEVNRLCDRVREAKESGAEAVLRLHPSQDAAALDPQWAELASLVDDVVVGTAPLAESLHADDIVVVISSSSAVDALARGVQAEVLADPERVLPADLEALVAARRAGIPVEPAAHVVAVGEEAKRRITAILSSLRERERR